MAMPLAQRLIAQKVAPIVGAFLKGVNLFRLGDRSRPFLVRAGGAEMSDVSEGCEKAQMPAEAPTALRIELSKDFSDSIIIRGRK
ncbi:MAG TPA: hypothetical protein VGS07_26485 [Thermoanaerobaculia bacterium]|jgi:hypothetical protein|nr:hypothetical protein [Thermoanaerobaculia bacterium]